MRILDRVNLLAKQIKKELGRNLIGVRVFHKCLLLYFSKGRTRFYSKNGQDWGKADTMYFVTVNFNLENINTKLWQQYRDLITWTSLWVEASAVRKWWLYLEYNIKYAS
jgi:hypothetical protein